MSHEPIASYPRYVAELIGDGPVEWKLHYEEPAKWRNSQYASGRRMSLPGFSGSAPSREAAIVEAQEAAREHVEKVRRETIVERVEVFRVPPTAQDLEDMLHADELIVPRGPGPCRPGSPSIEPGPDGRLDCYDSYDGA